jgi:hypothetical protein
MLRRLIAAALALTVAVPLPALAGALTERCMMDAPMLAAERCDCCTAPMAAGSSHCGASAAASSGCGCELRADTSSETRTAVTPSAPTVHFQIDATLLAADRTTPRRSQRTIALAQSPPGAGAVVSRPVLCSWII